MKFEKDFDFESANAQFNNEELDREFHNKLKLKEDKLEKQERPVNGEDKGDSGVETQNSEGNANEEDPLGPNCYYDKTKSFFDNISCDDNRERRPTWAEERRLKVKRRNIWHPTPSKSWAWWLQRQKRSWFPWQQRARQWQRRDLHCPSRRISRWLQRRSQGQGVCRF
jgi:hypothetical protein